MMLFCAIAPFLGPRTASAVVTRASVGSWSTVPSWPAVVAMHTHLLPNGKVLLWNRAKTDDGAHVIGAQDFWVWDPATGDVHQGANTETNLFCSGHAFLPDGRLLVVGGTIGQGKGSPDASIFDFRTNEWTVAPDMNGGRWYPTATALAGGGVLVSAGNDEAGVPNDLAQVWKPAGGWRNLRERRLPMYPWTFQAPGGDVFYAGPKQPSAFLSPQTGAWRNGPRAAFDMRRNGTAVMFDGKVLIIGGGTPAPTATAEIIDLTAPHPTWTPAGRMASPRRHHNATLLPDGTVLVTGGQRQGENDASLEHAGVREAELYEPATGRWTTLSAMHRPRAYHSTALLLPDGRVLVAGSGAPAQVDERNAEIFSPPYLFKGARPTIARAPATLTFGRPFIVESPNKGQIAAVRLIRLGSVTHSFNQNQRLNTLTFSPTTNGLRVDPPANGQVAPPGQYLLFVLNQAGVPSIGKIVTLGAGASG